MGGVLKSWNLGLISLVSDSEDTIYQHATLLKITSIFGVSISSSVNNTFVIAPFES